jgi:Holliday junction resolvasome RuvABC DNA-binding subunit
MIRAATLEELSSLPGINRKVAEVIKKGLNSKTKKQKLEVSV